MAKWTIQELQELPKNLELTIHPLIAKLLFAKGYKTEQEILSFLTPDYEKDLHDPFLFEDMEKVVARVNEAKEKDQTVAIFGDYDADGITSSAILKETLDNLAIKNFVYIPDKKSEGYSMNVSAVEMFKEKNVSLIITVDCGITSISEVARAKELGIDVVITDHHHVPDKVPDAFAIINPHAPDCAYPFADLAGVGVAFKVVQGIYLRLLPEKYEQTKWMLDLVAIGTIADCVPLLNENRLFVKYGLMVLAKTRRIGLKEMFTVGRMMIDEYNLPDTKKVAFYVAPRINAAGRINHANLAYNLVTEENVSIARDLALELEANNTQRQKITDVITQEVKVLAENMYKDKKFIFAIGEHFPIGIVGLVAGKIAQKFNKPTAVFQKGEKFSKGSFRSIPQINIIETLGKCTELLERCGGHSQAAGATVANENLEAFYEKMNSLISEQLEGIDLDEKIIVDAEIKAEDVDFDFVEDLEKLKPFGEGNMEPNFMMKDLIIREKRVVGSGNKHIKFFLSPANGSPKLFEAISFNGYEKFQHFEVDDQIDILCNAGKDEWNGNKKIQFTMLDARNSVSTEAKI